MVSLATRHYRAAEHRAALLDAAFDDALRRARENMTDAADLNTILREYLKTGLEIDLDTRAMRPTGRLLYGVTNLSLSDHPDITPADVDLSTVEWLLGEAREALAERNTRPISERVQGLMDAHGLPEEARPRLALGVLEVHVHLLEEMRRRCLGEVPLVFDPSAPSSMPTPQPLAAPPPLPAPAASKVAVVSFDTAQAGWAADNGHTTKPGEKIKRALYDRTRTMYRLGLFLGHRDAARVTKADVVRWKEDKQARGNSVLTIRNDLSEMSAIWKVAIKNDKLKVNPFEGVSPPKPKRKPAARRAFTNEEAVAILTAARGQRGYMRWLPWVCCFTGARLSEVCQSTKEDVAVMDGVHVLRIHDEGEEGEVRSIKNEDSRRNVPIHPALVAEGFLSYVAALPAGSPLFPDAEPDKVFGQRGILAGKKVGRWLKVALKITDPKISPSHSWRHWFIGACRGVAMHQEVRSALTGHSAKADESAQYGAGMGSFIKVLSDALATVPSPLPPSTPPEPAVAA